MRNVRTRNLFITLPLKKLPYCLLFWIASQCLASDICFFTPPPQWECVKSQRLSNHVQIGFLGKGEKAFRPSLNCATEEIDLSLKEYIKAVRAIHEEMQMPWRDLGEFSCKAGKGRLAEITGQSPCGDVKMLQMIFVKDKMAYILTGAVLGEEFASQRETLLTAIRSMDVVQDLFSPIGDELKRSSLKQMYMSFETLPQDKQQSAWEQLQREIGELSSLGTHWQFLALQEGHQKLFGKNPSAK